jgi:hypothetical protein
MILTNILLFIFKRFLLKTTLLGNKEILDDLRKQIRDQQELIDYQTKKIIELQRMILVENK